MRWRDWRCVWWLANWAAAHDHHRLARWLLGMKRNRLGIYRDPHGEY